MILSVNRFERKKNLHLAIEALRLFRDLASPPSVQRRPAGDDRSVCGMAA